MNEKDLRAIIEQVLSELGASAANTPAAAQAVAQAVQSSNVESGELPDVTAIDIRTQYLVKNPEHGEEYAELKYNAPCRLGIGRAGARYQIGRAHV